MTNFKIDRTQITNFKYLKSVIEEAIDKNVYNTNQFDVSKQQLTGVILTTLNDDIRGKYGDTSFMQRLKYNPYILIKEAVDYSKKHNMKELTQFQKVDYVDPTTHKKVKDKQVMASMQYQKGKAFYNNLIKQNGLTKEFQVMAEIGIYGEHNAIVYENFKQAIGFVQKKVNGHIVSGTVSVYEGRGKKKIYIIEWTSQFGVEMLNANQFKSRYPNFR